jgi:hypothetical protein
MPGSFQGTKASRSPSQDESCHNLNTTELPNTSNCPNTDTHRQIAEQEDLWIQTNVETDENQNVLKKHRVDDGSQQSFAGEERALIINDANR